MNNTHFSSLGLKPLLLDNLALLEYASMTAIQARSLPVILTGRDVIAQGQTGSGKTAAFGLGVLNKLNEKLFKSQVLVLCPTRELSEQIATEIRRLARSIPNVKVMTLYGGTPMRSQVESLSKGVHIVVGTPGRIDDHLSKGTLDLGHIETLVLDEADRMLDMGFEKTLDAIIEKVPTNRQTLLFSATFPAEIKRVAERITHQPEFIQVAPSQDSVRIDESIYLVEDDTHRALALKLLLLQLGEVQAIVFCNTKQQTQTVTGGLKSAGFSAAALHGDLEQKDRDQTLIRFSNGSINTLVATDVAARGLDIESLELVINYQLPRELLVYTHRIGRTGRAGEKGQAFSLIQASEQFKLEQLEAFLERRLAVQELPPLELLGQAPPRPAMSTLRVTGGKKQRLRPGDFVGALTQGGDLQGELIGKIQVMDSGSYIAIRRSVAKTALRKLSTGKIKGRSFKARLI